MRLKTLFFLLVMMILGVGGALSQGTGDVAPLLVPTLVPTPVRGILDTVPSQSTVARLVQSGQVRVGLLYNEPPFGELTVRGEVRGFDADLARKIAEVWGIEAVFVQVTRQSALEQLQAGNVDMLLSAQVRRRDADLLVEFSQPYRMGRQAMMVRNDDPAETLFNMTSRKIGYVVGTEGDRALREWQSNTGISLLTHPYYTLDNALSALFSGEVDGIVGRQEQLLRVAGDYLFSIKLLDEAVAVEPFSVAFVRQDVSFRNLVNRTLQYLIEKGEMDALYRNYFQGQAFALDSSPVWENVGEEAPQLAQFNVDVRFPQQYAVPRLLSERKLRVAGLTPPPSDASAGQALTYQFNQRVVDEMARRWGVQVEYVEGGDVFELIELGLADIAVGVHLDWNFANRVDFSQPYMLHGDRLMVESRISIGGFNDLRNKWIAIMTSDEGAQARAQAWADSVNARVRFYSTREQEASDVVLLQNNADVVYGDSLKLIAHLQAHPNDLRLTERWYSRYYVGFALPYNDADLRLLVDYTLQEMQNDGTLRSFLEVVIPAGSDFPVFLTTTGDKSYYGIRLTR